MLFNLGHYEILIILGVLIFFVIGVQGLMGMVLFFKRRRERRRAAKKRS
ncbi:MAG: hypothetical protein RL885_16490 [Planctomycetota bacterium]